MNKLQGKRIFFALSADESVTNQWQYFHFIDELKRYNIEFEIFNINDYRYNDYQGILIDKIKANQKNISIFLTAYHDNQISPETILAIKQLGIPTLLICYDNLSMPHVHKNICRYFDLVWLTSHETEYLFKEWGAKTIFLPYAANPYKYFPSFIQEQSCVGFIGSLYGARSYKIKILSDNKIPVKIYTGKTIAKGNSPSEQKKELIQASISLINTLSDKYYLVNFKEGRKLLKGDLLKAIKNRFARKIAFNSSIEFHESVSFDEMNVLYSNFALSLGITEVWNTYLLKKPLYKLHLRTFEIPMCGGIQITHRNPELENYFEDEKEIILFDSEYEMIDKIKYYLSNDRASQRLKMKQSARLRAEKEHCWKNRFDKINQKLFN